MSSQTTFNEQTDSFYDIRADSQKGKAASVVLNWALVSPCVISTDPKMSNCPVYNLREMFPDIIRLWVGNWQTYWSIFGCTSRFITAEIVWNPLGFIEKSFRAFQS